MIHNSKLAYPRGTGAYKVAGTDSFRLSCSMLFQSKLKLETNNLGTNMQNWEKNIREMFIPDDGYSFVQVDQAGAEALIVAYLCRPGKYRQLFENGIKPHTYLAFKLFIAEWCNLFPGENILQLLTLSIPELKDNPLWKKVASTIKDSDNWISSRRFYHIAKKTIHAGSYGMRGNTFRLTLLKESGGTIVLNSEQAEKFLEGFHKEFPEIREFHAKILELALSKEELRNLFNFPFKITDYINKDDIKDLISWIPQSTVACITRQAYIKLQAFIVQEKLDWHLLGDTHDSYVTMVPDAEVKDAAKVMKDIIEVDLISPYDGTKFKMRSEAQAGKNWAPRKEKNPDGLLEVDFRNFTPKLKAA